MRQDRLRRWRIERAIRRMRGIERDIFLAVRVDGLDYRTIGERFGIGVAEVERHVANSLAALMQATDGKDPWWWRFRPW